MEGAHDNLLLTISWVCNSLMEIGIRTAGGGKLLGGLKPTWSGGLFGGSSWRELRGLPKRMTLQRLPGSGGTDHVLASHTSYGLPKS